MFIPVGALRALRRTRSQGLGSSLHQNVVSTLRCPLAGYVYAVSTGVRRAWSTATACMQLIPNSLQKPLATSRGASSAMR